MSTVLQGAAPAALAPGAAEPLLRPMLVTGRAYKRMVFLLTAVIAWGAFAFLYQGFVGLGVTGLRRTSRGR